MAKPTNSTANTKRRRRSYGKHRQRWGRAGDPRLEGSAVIAQSRRRRHPGISARPHRVREWLHLKELELKARARDAGQELSDDEASRQAEAAYRALRRDPNFPAIERAFEKTAPSGTSPKPSDVEEKVEIAAVLQAGPMAWLVEYLKMKTNQRGFPGDRDLVVSVLLQMAFGSCRPEVASTRAAFTENQPLLNWAYGYPGSGQGSSAFYGALAQVTELRSPQTTIHANLELIRRLAAAKNPDGALRHPRAGLVGIVDAMMVQADVAQRSPRDETHRRILCGGGREKVRPLAYTDENGNLTRFNHGNKLVMISCQALHLPLVWTIARGDCDERAEARKLLELLFRLWPDCPMEYLVGDALYDQSKAFAHDLLFNLGLVLVTPRAGEYARSLAHVATEGVPHCKCGEMKLKDTDGFYTAARRVKEGIPRGQQVPDLDARLRWICPNRLCRNETTRPFDDPRLYSYLPRAGSSKRAAFRSALLVRRNQIECIFSSLKQMQLAGVGISRAKWARDAGMDWLLSLGSLYLTARRFAHEESYYEPMLAEARELGLLTQPSEAAPAPGPSGTALKEAQLRRPIGFGEAEQPATWSDSDQAADLELAS